ncbi:Orf4 [Heliothis zea nudivirus]|uniref:Orf4 n=1 Tax=Heliothis zea nudivirus 1 TaxID=3116536 RepID=Q8JKV6_9VIRU|nr:Orf4 [Heliothis zea nudivirus]AAN04302.1 Orf4 [Heliothis zea nudivirus]
MVCYADTMDSTDAFDAPSPVQKEFSLVEYILDEAEERRRLNRECRSYREFKRRLKNLKHQREARRQSFDSSRDSTTNVSIVTNTSTSTAATDDDDTVATATTATHGDIEAARNVAATTTTTKSKSRPKARSRSKSIPIPMPVPMTTTANAIATTVNATSTSTTTTNGLLKPLKIKTKRPHIEDSDTDDADYAPPVNYGKRRRVSMSSMPSVPSVPSNANTNSNSNNNSNNNNSSISIYNGVKSNAKSNSKSNGTNVNSVHPPPTTTLANPCKIQAPTKNLDKIREQRKHDRYRKRDRKRKAEPIVDFDGAVNKLIKSELNVDVEVMPPPSIKPRRKKAKATCKYCRKVISNRSNLLRHVRDVHKKDTSRYDSQCSSSAEDLIQSDNNNNFSSNLKRVMLHGKPNKPAAVENIVIECTPFDDGMMYKHFMADSDDLEDEVVEKEPDYYNVKTPDLFHDEKMNIPKLTSAQIHGPRGNGVDNGIVYIKADSYAASINLFNCQGIKRKDKGTSVKNTASKDTTSKDTTSKAVTNKSITNKDTIKDINKTNDASITKSTNVNNSVNSSSLNEEDESHQSMPEYSNPEYSQPEYSNHLNDNVNEDVHVNEDVNKSVNIGEECNDNGNEQSDVDQVDELDAINNVDGGAESNVEIDSNVEMESNVEIDSNVEMESNVDEVEQENSQESLQEEVTQDESQTEANEDDQSQNEEHDTIDDDEQTEEQQEYTEEQEHTEDQQECTEDQQEHSEAEPEEGSDSESESGSESGSGSSSSSGSDSESNSDAESNAESEDEDNASEQPAEAKVEVSGVDSVNDDVEECVVVESVQPEEVAIQEMVEIELPNLELEHELDDFPEPEGALSSDDLEPKRVDLQCEIDELMNDHVAFSKDSTIEAFNKIDELLSTIQPLPMNTMEPLADDDVNEDLNSLANTISNALIPNGCNVISNGMQPLVDSGWYLHFCVYYTLSLHYTAHYTATTT